MIEHLSTKISEVTNKDKAQLKKELFIMWEQPQVLSAYFKQKQLEKWNVKVSDDDIVYESDWFPEETMTIWEEIQDNKKTWNKCQKFFEICTLQENSASIPRDKQMKPSTRAPKQI